MIELYPPFPSKKLKRIDNALPIITSHCADNLEIDGLWLSEINQMSQFVFFNKTRLFSYWDSLWLNLHNPCDEYRIYRCVISS